MPMNMGNRVQSSASILCREDCKALQFPFHARQEIPGLGNIVGNGEPRAKPGMIRHAVGNMDLDFLARLRPLASARMTIRIIEWHPTVEADQLIGGPSRFG